MAGHSKWANIKHRKSRQDAKKGAVFAKLIKQITVAAKGNPSEQDNPKLRAAVEKALSANMTREVINRAIDKGNSVDAEDLEEVTYEGYGVSGVAVIIETLTNNRNRTAPEIRHAFSKCGGSLGNSGSVNYMFKSIGQLVFASTTDEDELLTKALDAGACDMQTLPDGNLLIITEFEDFGSVKDKLELQNLQPLESNIDMESSIKVEVTDQNIADQLIRMFDMLDDLDDVQNVYHNAIIADSCFE